MRIVLNVERSILKVAKKADPKTKAAPTPEAKEKQMINYAMELAEKQLKEGTASASVIAHFLKLGATETQKKIEMLENQTKLYKARADSLEREKENENTAKEALAAMKKYGGTTSE